MSDNGEAIQDGRARWTDSVVSAIVSRKARSHVRTVATTMTRAVGTGVPNAAVLGRGNAGIIVAAIRKFLRTQSDHVALQVTLSNRNNIEQRLRAVAVGTANRLVLRAETVIVGQQQPAVTIGSRTRPCGTTDPSVSAGSETHAGHRVRNALVVAASVGILLRTVVSVHTLFLSPTHAVGTPHFALRTHFVRLGEATALVTLQTVAAYNHVLEAIGPQLRGQRAERRVLTDHRTN